MVLVALVACPLDAAHLFQRGAFFPRALCSEKRIESGLVRFVCPAGRPLCAELLPSGEGGVGALVMLTMVVVVVTTSAGGFRDRATYCVAVERMCVERRGCVLIRRMIFVCASGRS